MNEQRTPSMLGRVPMILAVTAASYGLPLEAQVQRDRTDRGKAMPARSGVTHARPTHKRLVSQH